MECNYSPYWSPFFFYANFDLSDLMFRFFFHELPDFPVLFIECFALLFDFCAWHHDLYSSAITSLMSLVFNPLGVCFALLRLESSG